MPAKKSSAAGQLARVRRVCLAIPGAIEKTSHGAPTFFTPKRVFTVFAENYPVGRVAVWIPAAPGAQASMIEEAPEVYFRPPYVGPNGWVGVELDKVDDEQLAALIHEAFHLIQSKDRPAKRLVR
jgi:hypothetical protein